MINKTFRLFISSTFVDFTEERASLNGEIFPVIDEFCKKLGYSFQLIDLRWGINNESSLNQNTLDICLDEVKRCKELSPKPNFLILVGERYGWVPLPTKIHPDEFNKIISAGTSEEASIIKEWYILDRNEMGGIYYLKSRIGKYIYDDEWNATESLIHKALVNCASKAENVSNSLLKMLNASATEQEIFEGLLNNKDICDNAIALFRNNYPQKDNDLTSIDNLKKAITEKLETFGCRDNLIELQWDEKTYLNQFKECIISSLKENILKEINRLESAHKNENINLLLLQEFFSDVTVEREDEYKKITDYVYGNINKPLFLIGDSGCGKSTLLAEYIKKNQENTFFAFYGLNIKSYTIVDALNLIKEQIYSCYRLNGLIEIDYINLSGGFYELLSLIPKDKKAVIIIDGLDMFNDINDIKEQVFSNMLPENVKLIVSVANGTVKDAFVGAESYYSEIGAFSFEESTNHITHFLSCKNRCISSEKQKAVLENVISNGSFPLQLKLMTNICSKWRSGDEKIFMADNPEDIVFQYITEMFEKFGHNKELVLTALSLVAVSPIGITEDEIQQLLLKFTKVRNYFVLEDRYNHNLEKLPFIIWSKLFYDLKGCLSLVKSNDFTVVKFSHMIFYKVFLDKFSDYCTSARKMLIEYYLNQENYIKGTDLPNAHKINRLLSLLRQTNDMESVSRLYRDLSFVDCVVKLDGISYLLSDVGYLIENSDDSKNDMFFVKLFNCVYDNRELLSCYCGEFITCAKRFGLVDGNCVIRTESDSNSYFYFPYPAESKVFFNEDASRYAVFYRNYIYICDEKSKSELCRIYLESEERFLNQFLIEIAWITSTKIAVSFEQGVYIYDFSDSVPNLVKTVNYSFNGLTHISFSSEYNILFVVNGKELHAINAETLEEKYVIKGKIKFNIALKNDDIFIKFKHRQINVYSIYDGTLKKRIRLKIPFEYDDNFNDYYSLHSVGANLLFESTDMLSRHFRVYDISKGKGFYIHPPMIDYLDKWIVGSRYFLMQKNNFIMAIDLVDNCRLSIYKIKDVQNIFWKKTDESIFITLSSGAAEANLSDFEFVNGIEVFKHKRNLYYMGSDSLKPIVSLLTQFIIYRKKEKASFSEMCEYQWLFDNNASFLPLFKKDKTESRVSLVVEKNGLKAVAYESESCIIVYDRNDNPIFSVDKLKLGIFNNILNFSLSDDANYLLIHTNDFLKVINIRKAKEVISLSTYNRPIHNVFFDRESSVLHMVFYDDKNYSVDLSNPSHDLLPPILSDDGCDKYRDVYNSYRLNEKTIVNGYLDYDRFESDVSAKGATFSPEKWFNNKMLYKGDNHCLLFENGVFYLDGDKDKAFTNRNFNFLKSKKIEQSRCSSQMDGYLKEKNDLFSNLYEFKSRYLLLVSRGLGSVVVFDMSDMKVVEAYKLKSGIVGCELINSSKLKLFIEKEPYTLNINIFLIKHF